MTKSRWVVGAVHRIWWQDISNFVKAEVFKVDGLRACLVINYEKTRVITWLTWDQLQMLKDNRTKV